MESKASPVKHQYDSSRRRAVALSHQARVLRSARRRFLQHGYATTTLDAVATDAGVSIAAIYKAFRNKAGLLKAVFDLALAGDDAPVPIAGRSWVAEIIAEPSPQQKLRMYAQQLSEAMPRTAPIQLLARAAAMADPALQMVWQEMSDERLKGMSAFAEHLAAGGHLRAGLDHREARDVLWTCNSVALYELLVLERDWPVDRYRGFIADTLISALLPSASGREQ